jgi:hypothetical protein
MDKVCQQSLKILQSENIVPNMYKYDAAKLRILKMNTNCSRPVVSARGKLRLYALSNKRNKCLKCLARSV